MTGIVEEYHQLQAETDADLLAMQVGDFYEFFAEDARTVADELDLKLSEKSGSSGQQAAMAGVPVDELTPYLVALVERGYRVAVADQHETDGGHARSVTRVVTPGTLLETTEDAARYLAAVARETPEGPYGLAFVDASTGRFLVTTVADSDAAVAELYRVRPAELLVAPDLDDAAPVEAVADRLEAVVSDHEAEAFAPGRATHALREQFGAGALESVGVEPESAAARAAGAALDYVRSSGLGVDEAFTRLQPYRADDHVALDATTQRNLELTEPMTPGGRTLLDTVDHTVTAGGRRLLREWLQRPRRDLTELERRAGGVAALAEAALARDRLRELLESARDLERLAGRASHGSADARDLLAVRDTLALLPECREVVEDTPALADGPVADVLERPDAERAADLRARLEDALVEDPPATTTEGGLFRRGYDEALDELAERHESLLEWFDDLAERESERLGVRHLQVDRNSTDGYYLQVGKSETDAVPETYREIKTLKSSRRYVTEELEERERELLEVEQRRHDLEAELFAALRERVAAAAATLQATGRALAEVDVLASLAEHAVANDWVRPELAEDGPIDLADARHPVVEQTTEFVPNDARLDDDRRFLLVTGPNMSGKSTYMRQVALVVLLAQVGSFVPAGEARIGLVDGIYTRVGALDELAEGRSTFMVEMQELSNILHSATDESLVVLDEVGRGTATYDGISIAWAATEYLHNRVGARTLFATHYHELTGLAEHLERVANVHVAAEERDGEVTFLRAVREGATDRSYGIHVADLAGVPAPVVDRARTVLDRLREEKAVEARGEGGGEPVQAVFDLDSGEFRNPASADGGDAPLEPETESVLEELRALDVASEAPIDLMARVREWQRRVGEEP